MSRTLLPRIFRPRWRSVLDAALTVLFLLVGSWWGARFERAWHATGRQAVFYQGYFEPAVMMACGHGFVRPEPRAQVDGLDDFLSTRRDDMPCDRIPANVRVVHDVPVRSWYHFMVTVAAVWRILGVSWSGLNPLFGLLFGLVLVIAYGLFRLGLGQWLSALGAFLLAVSPVHLVNLPHLRDYAKAPFTLAALLLAGWMVTRPFKARRVLILATAAGIVVGVGYGFRTDLLAAIPPLLVTVLLFLPGGLRRNVATKLCGAALLLAAFIGASWPALSYRLQEGGCQGHVMLVGLAMPFDRRLGIEPASYAWSAHSADAYIHTSVGAYANRGEDGRRGPGFCTTEYDQETQAYFMTIARLFPADMATRALASIAGVSNVAFASRAAPIEQYDGTFYRARCRLIDLLSGQGVLFVAVASLLIILIDLRLGLWALFVLFYFGAYPMLQFHPRHHFHLEWLGWFALAFPLALAPGAFRRGRGLLRGCRAAGGRLVPSVVAALRAPATRALVWLAMGSLIFGGLAALRTYQSVEVHRLLQDMLMKTTQPVALVNGAGDRTPFLQPAPGSLPSPDERGPFWSALLRLHVRSRKCTAITLRYERTEPQLDFSQAFRLDPREGEASLLFPVFQGFRGFEVEGGDAACISEAYRADDLAKIPLWLFAVVPRDPTLLRPYQTIRSPTR